MYIVCTTALTVDREFMIPRLSRTEPVSTDIRVRSLTFLSYLEVDLELALLMSPHFVTIPGFPAEIHLSRTPVLALICLNGSHSHMLSRSPCSHG